jgi:indole-3-glycerol phosphate synthase
MNILEQIIAHKKTEVAERRALVAYATLEADPRMTRAALSLRQSLLDPAKTGIIAEFKRRSPSKGIINATAGLREVTAAYTLHGASGISVLTDMSFFGGADTDLVAARENNIPLLRKDFIIDEYQILEAKILGADVILLIAACLSTKEASRLAGFAQSLGLEVLLEIHNEAELEHINAATTLVGINNRDLKTFTVDIARSIQLAGQLPKDKLAIAESGIDEVSVVHLLKREGFSGFLIGEHFMKTTNPAIAFADFVHALNKSYAG